MATPGYTTVIELTLTEIDEILSNYVYNGYTALADYLTLPLGIAITLYIIFYGYSMTMGWARVSVGDFSKSIVRIGLIYLFAMHWSWFSDYFVTLIFDVSGHIGDVLVSSTNIPLPSFAGEGITGAMQSVLIELWEMGQWAWNGGSFHNWAPLFIGLALWVCGFLLIGIGLFEIIFAKCILSVLCVLAPLFISFTLFDSTREFFNRWVGLCAAYSFLMILVMAATGLAMSVDQWAIADAYVTKIVDLPTIAILAIIFVSLLCVGIIIKVEGLALALGGFVGESVSNSSLAGNISKSLGGTFGIAAGVISKRKSSGRQRSSSQKNVEKMRLLLARSKQAR